MQKTKKVSTGYGQPDLTWQSLTQAFVVRLVNFAVHQLLQLQPQNMAHTVLL